MFRAKCQLYDFFSLINTGKGVTIYGIQPNGTSHIGKIHNCILPLDQVPIAVFALDMVKISIPWMNTASDIFLFSQVSIYLMIMYRNEISRL